MVKDDQGKMLGVAAIMRDATAQKAAEKELRERLRRLEEKA